MPRRTFHEELKHLRQEVLKMGRLVEKAVEKSVKALINSDMGLAKKVVAGDDDIDDLYLNIEEQALALVARQAPVAKDLRLIHSVIFLAGHLERMGDLSLNIAKTAQRTAKAKGIQSLLDLLSKMDVLTRKLISASMEAFKKKDCALAKSLPDMDEPIDDLFKEFIKELSRVGEEESMEWASNMVLASRWLERIADHAVDIGERVCYLVTGEFEELD